MLRLDSIILLTIPLTCGFNLFITAQKHGFGPGKQDWGHVTVREGAHMFYWLYYTMATYPYTERPLVIWLQGGPGDSSTGLGNFEEIGPLSVNLQPRNSTWIKYMNVMFVDSPVGTGFSYVDNPSAYAKNNSQIALDLVEFMKKFYIDHPDFKKVPLHIFSEGYGGKMASEFVLELYRSIERKEIESNLKSVNLGAPWISPVDAVNAWAPYLLNMGMIDEYGYDNIMYFANITEKAVKERKFAEAYNNYIGTQISIFKESGEVEFFNVLRKVDIEIDEKQKRDKLLEDLMRTNVSVALNITSNPWGSQSETTFSFLIEDFMKDGKSVIESLLSTTTVKVSVYSGQLDLMCATPGVVKWVNDLKYQGIKYFKSAPRNIIIIDKVLELFEKTKGNFTMFWINRAGHMVPLDNPAAAMYMLKRMTGYP